jgi:hypothetical protein
MAVGSVGETLAPYGESYSEYNSDKTEECDTFLSTDAGLTWTMVQEGAHTYEFGDQGSILVIADDEDVTDHVHYSYDGGKTWYVLSHTSRELSSSRRNKLDLGLTVRSLLLTTIPDSTSQK